MGWASNACSQVLIDWEVSYKTPHTGSGISSIKLPFNSCSLQMQGKPQPVNVLGAGRNIAEPFYGNKSVTGNLTGSVDLIAIGYILTAVFGVPTTTGSGSPYTHTFKIGNSTPSFILEKGWTDEARYYLYTGCKANGFSVTINQQGQFQYSVPIIAATEDYSGTSYQASPTTDVSKPTKIFNVQDVSSVSEGGSPVTNIDEITFNFGNGSTIGFGLGSGGEGTVAAEGGPTFNGTIKGMFTADTGSPFAKGRDQTESSLSVVLTSSTNSLTFFSDELKYSQESPPIDGPAGAMFSNSFEAFYQNAAGASAFRAVLINTQASYEL